MNKYSKYIAELLGTLLVVFIGAGAICAEHSVKMAGGQGVGPVWAITAFGIVIVAIVIRDKLHFRFSHKPGGNDLILDYREDICRYSRLLYSISIDRCGNGRVLFENTVSGCG